MRASKVYSRADLHQAQGVLLVVREPVPAPVALPGQPPVVAANPSEGVEILLALWDDGSVTALHGHVDLGTGLRTALTQIVADELDVHPERVHVLMGSTAAAPNQGATIASASLQIHAAPLRHSAAQARAWVVARAAEHLKLLPSEITLRDGVVFAQREAESKRIAVGDLLRAQHVVLMLEPTTPVKGAHEYRWVGVGLPRVDIAAKATGELTFVHDMRLPAMLHARVVRPPYAGHDSGEFVGNTLDRVERDSIAHIAGVRAVVVERDFVGVVTEREEHAEQAMRELVVVWKPWPGMPGLDDSEQAIRRNPSASRELVNEGDVEQALQGVSQRLDQTYVWPYQMHASIGPSCALAHWVGGEDRADPRIQLRVWAASQNPFVLRADLALLMGVNEVEVDVVRMEGAGCYGRNGADDVAADAALLSRAVGQPVRVQLSREQEHAWEPKGAAQLMQVRGGLRADGSPVAYDFQTSYPSNGAPTLALLLTRRIEPVARAYEMGDRTARPPYHYSNLRVTVHDMAPVLRASWLRGVSALPNAFAHESYLDELATAAGQDPVAYRLGLLDDPRARELVQATAAKANWRTRSAPQQQNKPNLPDGLQSGAQGDWLVGQGFAYARYMHSKWPGFGAAWSAWVADVSVNRVSGEVQVKRVVVGHDAGLMINPLGVQHQVHGNVLQTTSRALKEQVQIDPLQGTVTSLEWGSYPILKFTEVPLVEVVHMNRPANLPLGAGESSSVPGTAAIANAIFDATGVRFRNPPFTPELVRAALNPLGTAGEDSRADASPDFSAPKKMPVDRVLSSQPGLVTGWRRRVKQAAMLGVGAVLLAASFLGWRPALAPRLMPLSANPSLNTDLIERGRQLAALGNCAGCHTAQGGQRNAGGHPIETPFGVIYSTNLTPDAQTGIGQWSFQAFERAMREGVSRDGHALYPAFPFSAFANMRDEDMMALYSFLMSQPAVFSPVPETRLRFPFNVRALMALWRGWTAQIQTHQVEGSSPQISEHKSPEWNRGAYLVNGLGHCGGCHTPRGSLGQELSQTAYLQGAIVDGWEAPALTGSNRAPTPWSEASLFQYLRRGYSEHHGVAAGPMAQVVRELAQVGDADLRAMAVYLSDLNVSKEVVASSQPVPSARAEPASSLAHSPSQRLFEGSCGNCHHEDGGPQTFGLNLPLSRNPNLHRDQPNNLIRVILEGIQAPAAPEIGFMPSYANSLTDAQVAELVGWMRARYAPGLPPWTGLVQAVAKSREQLRASIQLSAKAAQSGVP